MAWDEAIADAMAGYGLTGGPLVANGKVMVGTTGRAPGGNFIVARDAETGKRAWRIATIAQPGESGGNSWNGLPLEKRNSASVWVPGSYDRVLNLLRSGPDVRHRPAAESIRRGQRHQRRRPSISRRVERCGPTGSGHR